MNSPKLVLLLALASLRSYAAPFITNGDFESGDTAFASGLSSIGNPCPNATSLAVGAYGIDTNASNCDTAALSFTDHSGSGNMLVANPSGPGTIVWGQGVSGISAGHIYVFSAYVHALTTSSGVSVQVYIDGTPVATPFTLSNSGSMWELLTVSLGPGAPFTAPGPHQIDIHGGALAIDGLSLVDTGLDQALAADPARSFPFALDTITITDIGTTPIPEPSPAVLAVPAFVAVALIRRRRTLRE